ncbi:MAG TPA: SDR family oxidoreductase [Acidobacteriaceae bacterium]|jgi:3-oxoacyl-[acyl-carrier protein] reductase/pteridine reductase|nr:SDR family oxidoreductase [Acidobacteriaceae bacterium]
MTPSPRPGQDRPLANQVALVTGAAKRIGRAIAVALADAGANVAITWRDSEAAARETVAALEACGVQAAAFQADVRIPAQIREAVQAAGARFGRLDILVNNAGLYETAPLQEITVEQWDAMFETNTRGPFLAAQAAYPHLKAVRGRIVNIGSLGGMHPWPTHAHYCTSKAALHMLTQTMSKAFAPEISVNCVAPGMIVNGEVAEEYEHFARRTPMQRNGTAEDVAAAVLFFATGPHFITGQILSVDGGLGL